jgi:hypothetical protein
VFQGLREDTARKAMTRVCKVGQILHFSPKNLRERGQDLAPRRTPGEDARGEARSRESVDEPGRVHAHARPGEVTADELQARL